MHRRLYEDGEHCRECAGEVGAPTPHPLDAACEMLAALAKDKTPEGVDRVTVDVWGDGRVLISTWGGGVERAHLHGADGLPLPSQALAALRGGK